MSFRGCFVLCFIFVPVFSFRFATKCCCYVCKKTLLLFFKSRLLSIITIVSKRLFNLSGVLSMPLTMPSSKFLHRFSLFFDVDRLFKSPLAIPLWPPLSLFLAPLPRLKSSPSSSSFVSGSFLALPSPFALVRLSTLFSFGDFFRASQFPRFDSLQYLSFASPRLQSQTINRREQASTASMGALASTAAAPGALCCTGICSVSSFLLRSDQPSGFCTAATGCFWSRLMPNSSTAGSQET